MAVALLSISLLFFLGHGLRWFFLKTKIPDLLILVLIGYIVGPTLGLISPEDLGKVGVVLSTLALVVILYEGGLELHASDLLKSSLPALGIASFSFTLTVIITSSLAYLVALQELQTSILFGLALGCVSAAIVIPMVKQLSISQKTKTILSLESAFTDVITIVVFLVIIDAFSSGEFSINKLIYGIGPKTFMSILLGSLSGLLWSWCRRRFVFLTDITFAGEAWAVLTYGLLELPHYNGIIGVFALGFTLGNLDLLPNWLKKNINVKPVSLQQMSLLGELTFLLKTFFFIYLGILIQFDDWKTVLFSLLIAGLIPITRYLSVKVLFRSEHLSRIDAMIITAMGPRGLATAVLATIPLQRGLSGGEWIQSTLFAVIPVSILITAVLVFLSEQAAFRQKSQSFFGAYKDESTDDNPA